MKIDESRDDENREIVASVPLLDAVNTTSQEIEQDVQCMATEKLTGCFKVRLTGTDKQNAHLALVDGKPNTIANSEATPRDNSSQARIHVWINGEYVGCFDYVIIITDGGVWIFH